ncbi:MAG TPA: phage tail sheath C-terminal domain-containing protein [Pyrinomonadaceae bacterium]|nr:phage tail sheath C-terminal domain-containing protein [Pyrinomonadaceae bacterium]
MPGTYTYPGVYIEEIPSGVRTITGVSTSDTAFVDFFRRGPLDKAVRISSFADFERVFGGLDTRSEASYAIQQYFLNGGSVAWVVRVAAGNFDSAFLTLQGGSPPQDALTVAAVSPGVWANNLQVGVDYKTADPATMFNLVVREVATVRGKQQVVNSEVHRNLSMSQASSRYAVSVVNEASSLVRLTDEGLGERPAATGADVIGAPDDADFTPLGGTANDGDVPGGNDWRTATGANAIRGSALQKTGLHALDRIDPFIFNILCIPAAADLDANGFSAVVAEAETYCLDKRAFLIVDIPADVDTKDDMLGWMAANDGLRHTNAAVYFPRLLVPDALNENRPRNVAASGTLAGVYARTDATRGVWKAPAGTDADLRGANLAVKIGDRENGDLNPIGINALRNFAVFGNVSWGARTLDGADQAASEWKYIPVRRLALYLEESLYQGSKWIVFEPNDEALWSQIRLNFGAFMHGLFRQGAFQGTTPREAYFVKCDKETTTQDDINRGVVNILVGFAPLKPAEFVVIKIQQMAGQIEA